MVFDAQAVWLTGSMCTARQRRLTATSQMGEIRRRLFAGIGGQYPPAQDPKRG